MVASTARGRRQLQPPDAAARSDAAESTPQELPAGRLVEHTPVAGSTSSTLIAADRSPAIHAVIERTCS
jgi:hypothetical protein